MPTIISSLVGRQRELAEIARVLRTARLVTLTGAGGVGKTGLALAAASTALENFADGVWLASLGSLLDPALVPHSVAAVCGVRERGGRSLLEDLIEALRERRLLLVLDNCEHLVDASARLVQALVQSCPGVCRTSPSRAASVATPTPARRARTSWLSPARNRKRRNYAPSVPSAPESGRRRSSPYRKRAAVRDDLGVGVPPGLLTSSQAFESREDDKGTTMSSWTSCAADLQPTAGELHTIAPSAAREAAINTQRPSRRGISMRRLSS